MHRPAPTTTAAVEVVAVYLGEKANTRRDQWAVHTLEVVSSSVDCFRVGMEIEATGNSIPYEIGSTTPPDLRKGCEYLFDGKIEVRKYRGQDQTQLKFANFTRVEPLTKQGVLRYLEELDVIGNKMAGAIFAEFGLDAVKVLRETPERTTGIRLRNGKRLSIDQANAASKQLKERQGLEHTTIQLMGLLNGYGLPKSTARKAIHKWGVRAAERIRRNPLGTLMAFKGCGFLKADKVYQSLNYPLDALKRMTLCAWHTLSSDANGHTWLPRAKVMNELRLKVGGIPSFPQAKLDRHRDKSKTPADWAVDIGIRAGLLAEYIDDAGEKWLAEGEKSREEERLAATILAAMDEPNPWEAVLSSDELPAALAPLEPYQRDALLKVLTGGAIGILGGGPGSGKTFTAAALMKLLVATFGAGQIAATAFTGKAARRFTEGMAAYQIPVAAVTTHSLLKVKNFAGGDAADGDDDDNASEFTFNATNPLPHRLIVVDEVSMDDVPLLLAILEARGRGCGVLLVGDVNQLPPIGHGAPLRDLIAAGLPYGELTEIRRNAGQVVRLCKKLREGSRLSITDFCRFEHLQPDAADPINCALVPASSPQAVHDEVVRVMKGARDRFGYDPIWDMQVIVATNKQRVELNAILQCEFNPTADTDGNAKFRVGDKIIALQNAAYPLVDSTWQEMPDSAAKVANGEFARIIAIQDRKIIAKFTTPNRTVALRKPIAVSSDGKEATTDKPGESEPRIPFDLGYAATCHKMQGSQAKFVVVALDKNTFNTSCEWFMTADSRPEKAVVNVGEFSTIVRMAGNKEIGKRKTFLRERIEAGRLWGERVWWGKEIQTETVTT